MTTKASLSTRISKKIVVRYMVALLATVAALLVRLVLNRFLGDYVPYITLFPAVAFCAWYCGVGPSILSGILGLVGLRYWFMPPAHSLRVHGMQQAASIVAFLLSIRHPDCDGRSASSS